MDKDEIKTEIERLEENCRTCKEIFEECTEAGIINDCITQRELRKLYNKLYELNYIY